MLIEIHSFVPLTLDQSMLGHPALSRDPGTEGIPGKCCGDFCPQREARCYRITTRVSVTVPLEVPNSHRKHRSQCCSVLKVFIFPYSASVWVQRCETPCSVLAAYWWARKASVHIKNASITQWVGREEKTSSFGELCNFGAVYGELRSSCEPKGETHLGQEDFLEVCFGRLGLNEPRFVSPLIPLSTNYVGTTILCYSFSF